VSSRLGLLILLAALTAACTGNPSNPVSPTSTPTCTDRNASNYGQTGTCVFPPPPPPVLSSSFTVSNLVIDCVRGLCFTATGIVTNNGPGCATGVQVLLRWYGSDGAVPLPNSPDVIMTAPGGLSTYRFGPRSQLVISNAASFNDVRSAHTVYRPIVSYNAVACS
jgi:hypothetical protein